MKITQDMVGLEFTVEPNMPVEVDFNEYRVRIRFEEISDEGLAVFGIKDERQ